MINPLRPAKRVMKSSLNQPQVRSRTVFELASARPLTGSSSTPRFSPSPVIEPPTVVFIKLPAWPTAAVRDLRHRAVGLGCAADRAPLWCEGCLPASSASHYRDRGVLPVFSLLRRGVRRPLLLRGGCPRLLSLSEARRASSGRTIPGDAGARQHAQRLAERQACRSRRCARSPQPSFTFPIGPVWNGDTYGGFFF
jgi:hypothetical protein